MLHISRFRPAEISGAKNFDDAFRLYTNLRAEVLDAVNQIQESRVAIAREYDFRVEQEIATLQRYQKAVELMIAVVSKIASNNSNFLVVGTSSSDDASNFYREDGLIILSRFRSVFHRVLSKEVEGNEANRAFGTFGKVCELILRDPGMLGSAKAIAFDQKCEFDCFLAGMGSYCLAEQSLKCGPFDTSEDFDSIGLYAKETPLELIQEQEMRLRLEAFNYVFLDEPEGESDVFLGRALIGLYCRSENPSPYAKEIWSEEGLKFLDRLRDTSFGLAAEKPRIFSRLTCHLIYLFHLRNHYRYREKEVSTELKEAYSARLDQLDAGSLNEATESLRVLHDQALVSLMDSRFTWEENDLPAEVVEREKVFWQTHVGRSFLFTRLVVNQLGGLSWACDIDAYRRLQRGS